MPNRIREERGMQHCRFQTWEQRHYKFNIQDLCLGILELSDQTPTKTVNKTWVYMCSTLLCFIGVMIQECEV